MSELLEKLPGGDLRSIGRADEVVEDILNDPQRFGEVFEGMLAEDPIIRMRSADVIEKVARQHPAYLAPYKHRLISQVSKICQQEVRWHVAQMFSYLSLDEKDRDEVVKILFAWLDSPDKSKIVKVCSMQTLADLAEQDNTLRPQVKLKLQELISTGSPAMVSRARKLLKGLR